MEPIPCRWWAVQTKSSCSASACWCASCQRASAGWALPLSSPGTSPIPPALPVQTGRRHSIPPSLLCSFKPREAGNLHIYHSERHFLVTAENITHYHKNTPVSYPTTALFQCDGWLKPNKVTFRGKPRPSGLFIRYVKYPPWLSSSCLNVQSLNEVSNAPDVFQALFVGSLPIKELCCPWAWRCLVAQVSHSGRGHHSCHPKGDEGTFWARFKQCWFFLSVSRATSTPNIEISITELCLLLKA